MRTKCIMDITVLICQQLIKVGFFHIKNDYKIVRDVIILIVNNSLYEFNVNKESKYRRNQNEKQNVFKVSDIGH